MMKNLQFSLLLSINCFFIFIACAGTGNQDVEIELNALGESLPAPTVWNWKKNILYFDKLINNYFHDSKVCFWHSFLNI